MALMINSDETFISMEMLGTVVSGITLIIYHYFFTKNNIDFLKKDMNLLKKNMKDLSDTLYSIINDKIVNLEEKYNNKIENLNKSVSEHNKHITTTLLEIKENEANYKNVLKQDIDQTNETIFNKIDELRNKLDADENSIVKLQTIVENKLTNNNDILMLKESISNLKEIYKQKHKNIDDTAKTHRKNIDTINKILFKIIKDK